MARINEKGYFCDIPCGFRNSKCQNFFHAGCATAGIRLAPNTEYPEYTREHVDEKSKETKTKETCE